MKIRGENTPPGLKRKEPFLGGKDMITQEKDAFFHKKSFHEMIVFKDICPKSSTQNQTSFFVVYDYKLLLQYYSHFNDDRKYVCWWVNSWNFFQYQAWKRTNGRNLCPLENKRKKLSSRGQKDKKGSVLSILPYAPNFCLQTATIWYLAFMNDS